MRVFLDACVPRRIARALTDLDVETVHARGWSDMDDGALLERLEGACEALVTVDANLPYQQQVAHRSFGVVVVRAKSNRLEDLLPWVPALRAALQDLKPGQVRWVPPLGEPRRPPHGA